MASIGHVYNMNLVMTYKNPNKKNISLNLTSFNRIVVIFYL